MCMTVSMHDFWCICMGVPAQPESLLEMLTLCPRLVAPISRAAHKGTSSITRCSAQRRCTLLFCGVVKRKAVSEGARPCTPWAINSSVARHLQGAAITQEGATPADTAAPTCHDTGGHRQGHTVVITMLYTLSCAVVCSPKRRSECQAVADRPSTSPSTVAGGGCGGGAGV